MPSARDANATPDAEPGVETEVACTIAAGADAADGAAKTGWRALSRRLGPVGGLAVIATLFPPLGGFLVIGTMGPVGAFLQELGWLGVGLYVVGFTVLAGFALLPTYAQALLGGWAFGVAVGIPAALLGFTGAAMIGYAIAFRVSGTRVTDLIDEKPKWRAVYHELLGTKRGGGFGRALCIITLIRLPPNAPFALTNLLLAAARAPWLAYVLGTAIGMLPRTAAAVVIAAGLSEFDPAQASQWWLLAAGTAVTVFVLIVIGALANRALAKVTGTTEGEEPTA